MAQNVFYAGQKPARVTVFDPAVIAVVSGRYPVIGVILKPEDLVVVSVGITDEIAVFARFIQQLALSAAAAAGCGHAAVFIIFLPRAGIGLPAPAGVSFNDAVNIVGKDIAIRRERPVGDAALVDGFNGGAKGI